MNSPTHIAVVTDTAASLPGSLAEAGGIHVVPMLITIGGTTYRDDRLPMEDLLARLGDGVSTSGPTPGEVAETIEDLLHDHDHVLVFTIADAMSSTFGSARTAARLFDQRVTVIDTRTAAGAQGLVVLAAAECATQGGSLEEVKCLADRVIDRVRLVATLPRLDFLVRSGRVPGIAGWAGTKLGVNPLFAFRGGGVHGLRPAFSREAALERILASWRSSRPAQGRLHLAALHASAQDDAQRLLDLVSREVRPETAFVGEFSPVMVAHTGPGLVGLAWWWE